MGLKFIIVGLLWLLSSSVFAAPYELSYGGRLTESSGKPLAGPVTLRVTFFRSAAGNDQIAVAIPDFTNVALEDGIFQITLNLSAADFHTVFNGTDSTFIQIEDLSHSTTYPRQKFSAVPYALKVPVNGSSITYNSNGELALGNGSNILSLPTSAGPLNQVLKSDGAGGLVWADDLTGGVGSITSSDIQDATIVNADISGTAAIATSKLSGPVTAIASNGLGDSATKNVGTAAGTVAAGDHAHSAATTSVAGFLSAADKTKLDGLGNASSKDVGSGAGDVAAGNHTHADATTGASGFMSAADKVRLNAAVVTTDTGTVTSTMIANGTIADADVSGTAAIATSKLSGSVTSIASHGLGNLATKNTIATADIDNSAVDVNKLADGSVSLAKLSATICAANQVLKMNGAGDALTCAADATSAGSYAAKSSDYTVTASDNDKLLDVTNQTTITLPAAATAGAGFRVTVKRSGTSLVRIMPNGAENIDGQNVGVMLAATNTSIILASSGSAWVIAGKDGTYVRSSTFSDFTCGGAGDLCYADTTAMALGYALTPGSKALEYVVAGEGFKVWKEIGGSRILKADGSDNWALSLNIDGKGFSATAFTAWAGITGRVCPTNVYIDDSNKFTTGNCVYYTSESTGSRLESFGNSQTTSGSIGLNGWNNYNSGSAKWYVGNIEICSKKGMRIPTIYETTTTDTTTTNRPTTDGSPTYAQATGVPALSNYTWTASAYTGNSNTYWLWAGPTVKDYTYYNNYSVRCILP